MMTLHLRTLMNLYRLHEIMKFLERSLYDPSQYDFVPSFHEVKCSPLNPPKRAASDHFTNSPYFFIPCMAFIPKTTPLVEDYVWFCSANPAISFYYKGGSTLKEVYENSHFLRSNAPLSYNYLCIRLNPPIPNCRIVLAYIEHIYYH